MTLPTDEGIFAKIKCVAWGAEEVSSGGYISKRLQNQSS